MLSLLPPDQQRPDRGPRNSSWQRAKLRLSLAVALSTIQVTVRLTRFHPNFEGGHLGVLRGLPPLYPFHQPHEKTCGSRRLCRVSPAAKALYIYKHPCLLRDSKGAGTASSGVVHFTWLWFKITWSVAKSSRVAEQCDVNIQSISQPGYGPSRYGTADIVANH
ncbi:hypothetical protein TNCV_3281751 [Trichonephila clavipes]|nr:hypothetical protein TNCV_3281751 [Trichonephila clavipes]